MKGIEKEILLYSYWEHFKYAKDLAQILPIHHPKRIHVQKHLDEIVTKLNCTKKTYL